MTRVLASLALSALLLLTGASGGDSASESSSGEGVLLPRTDPYDPSQFRTERQEGLRLGQQLSTATGDVPFTCSLTLSFPTEDTREVFFQLTENVNADKSSHRGFRRIAGLVLPFEEYLDRETGTVWQRDLRSGRLERNLLGSAAEPNLELTIPVHAVRRPATFVREVIGELLQATLVDYIGEELVDSRVCGVYELSAFGLPQNRLGFVRLRGRVYVERESGFLMKAELYEVLDFEEEPRLVFRAEKVGSSRIWNSPETGGERRDLQRIEDEKLAELLENYRIKVGWIDFDRYEMNGERLEKLESLQSQRIQTGKERVFGRVLGASDWREIEWYEKDGYVYKDDPNLEVNKAPILFPGLSPMLIREKLRGLLEKNEIYKNAFVSEAIDDNPDCLFFPDMSRFLEEGGESYGNLWFDDSRGIVRNMSILVHGKESGKITIYRVKFLT